MVNTVFMNVDSWKNSLSLFVSLGSEGIFKNLKKNLEQKHFTSETTLKMFYRSCCMLHVSLFQTLGLYLP